MEYQIVKITNSGIDLMESYPTKEKAEEKIKESYKRVQTKIVAIPELRLGLNLYKHNGTHAGTIVSESKCLYFINNVHDPSQYDSFVDKERMKLRFVNGYYDEGVEDFLPDYDGIYKKIESIDDEEITETDE